MGMTPVPKLNFSAGHDEWLGIYGRMVSTPVYYQTVADIIAETAGVFGGGCYFHIGMDEEHYYEDSLSEYQVQRRYELWWHDLDYIAGKTQASGCTPMMWPDMFWNNSETFTQQASREIIKCNWYYGKFEDTSLPPITTYDWLEKGGFMQMPTGSNWEYAGNFIDTVRYCRKVIAPEKLLGFLQTVWHPTVEAVIDRHTEAIDALAQARKEWEQARNG
jgi:hypothetical protein